MSPTQSRIKRMLIPIAALVLVLGVGGALLAAPDANGAPRQDSIVAPQAVQYGMSFPVAYTTKAGGPIDAFAAYAECEEAAWAAWGRDDDGDGVFEHLQLASVTPVAWPPAGTACTVTLMDMRKGTALARTGFWASPEPVLAPMTATSPLAAPAGGSKGGSGSKDLTLYPVTVLNAHGDVSYSVPEATWVSFDCMVYTSGYQPVYSTVTLPPVGTWVYGTQGYPGWAADYSPPGTRISCHGIAVVETGPAKNRKLTQIGYLDYWDFYLQG